MEEIKYGSNPMLENRREANETVSRNKRYFQILEVLKGKEMTFRDIAFAMYEKGYTPSPETTFSQPRVTELVRKGMIEPVGKVKSNFTGKKVTVFGVRNG
jgi:hypothetical protein